MWVVRLEQGWTLKLDRQIGNSGKHGLWSFHCSESTYAPSPTELLRTAALLPAEPKQGQMIEVSICDSCQAPEDWRFIGKVWLQRNSARLTERLFLGIKL